MPSHAPYTIAAVTAGVLGASYIVYRCYQKRLPTEWTQVGTLSDLYIYPIKSCGGIVADSLKCTSLGLRDGWLRDRILMVMDEKDNFITARICPELLLIETSINNSILTLKYQKMKPIDVNLAKVASNQKPQKATVWGVSVPVYDCGAEVMEWLTNLLNRPPNKFRLAYYASHNCRPLKLSKAESVFKITKNDTGAFPDDAAFHLINQASVDDLMKRISTYNHQSHITHNSFRPNFVLTGASAFEEDKWRYVKIGKIVFEIVKPCNRCLLTTIDPKTGIRDPETEPLETLRTYRQTNDPKIRAAIGSTPLMGVQMALRSGEGETVSLNDPIYAA